MFFFKFNHHFFLLVYKLQHIVSVKAYVSVYKEQVGIVLRQHEGYGRVSRSAYEALEPDRSHAEFDVFLTTKQKEVNRAHHVVRMHHPRITNDRVENIHFRIINYLIGHAPPSHSRSCKT